MLVLAVVLGFLANKFIKGQCDVSTMTNAGFGNWFANGDESLSCLAVFNNPTLRNVACQTLPNAIVNRETHVPAIVGCCICPPASSSRTMTPTPTPSSSPSQRPPSCDSTLTYSAHIGWYANNNPQLNCLAIAQQPGFLDIACSTLPSAFASRPTGVLATQACCICPTVTASLSGTMTRSVSGSVSPTTSPSPSRQPETSKVVRSEVLWRRTGPQGFGFALAFSPDLSALLVTQFNKTDSSATSFSLVPITDSNVPADMLQLVNQPNLEGLGSAVAFLPDLDHDGLPELLVGASLSNSQTRRSGSLVVFGPQTTNQGIPSLITSVRSQVCLQGCRITLSQDASVRLAYWRKFGTSILVTDIDGNGVPEVIVGAPGCRSCLENEAFLLPAPALSSQYSGAFWILRFGLQSGQLTAQSVMISASNIGRQLPVDAEFGYASAFSKPKQTLFVTSPGMYQAGGALFALTLSFSDSQEDFVQVAGVHEVDLSAIATVGERCGEAIVMLPDMDDDSLPEIVLGCPGSNVPRIIVLSLDAANNPKRHNSIFPQSGSTSSRFGASLVVVQQNVQGQAVLIVGAPGDQSNDNPNAFGEVSALLVSPTSNSASRSPTSSQSSTSSPTRSITGSLTSSRSAAITGTGTPTSSSTQTPTLTSTTTSSNTPTQTKSATRSVSMSATQTPISLSSSPSTSPTPSRGTVGTCVTPKPPVSGLLCASQATIIDSPAFIMAATGAFDTAASNTGRVVFEFAIGGSELWVFANCPSAQSGWTVNDVPWVTSTSNGFEWKRISNSFAATVVEFKGVSPGCSILAVLLSDSVAVASLPISLPQCSSGARRGFRCATQGLTSAISTQTTGMFVATATVPRISFEFNHKQGFGDASLWVNVACTAASTVTIVGIGSISVPASSVPRWSRYSGTISATPNSTRISLDLVTGCSLAHSYMGNDNPAIVASPVCVTSETKCFSDAQFQGTDIVFVASSYMFAQCTASLLTPDRPCFGTALYDWQTRGPVWGLTRCTGGSEDSWYVNKFTWNVPQSSTFQWHQVVSAFDCDTTQFHIRERNCQLALVYRGFGTPTQTSC